MSRFKDIPKITVAYYRINMPFDLIEDWIKKNEDIIDLSPDYQRDHVWTEDQEISFVEWILRGGSSGQEIYWNCPGWMISFKGPLELVDGKQRVKAVLRFMHDEIPAFGCKLSQYEDHGALSNLCLMFNVADLKRRADVLQWYVDLNRGGTVHNPEEIDRVVQLIEAERVRYSTGSGAK